MGYLVKPFAVVIRPFFSLFTNALHVWNHEKSPSRACTFLYNSKVSCEMCCNSQNKTLTFGGSVLMEEMSRISVLLNMRVKETKL